MRNKKMFRYLPKNIPDYPNPVEFHIREVTHVTNKTNLPEIWKSEGFKGFKDFDQFPLSWWSLTIKEENIREAEERYLESLFPDRTQENLAEQQPFLKDFTKSPTFENCTSRYGNFRFTFPLTELMKEYKQQMCGGEDPVLRVYQTKLYKKAIVYAVLIHRPQLNENFKDYPELTSGTLVSYESGKIIWKAQAICENHSKKMILNRLNKTATIEQLREYEFYVWDDVSLAFHLDENEIFNFPRERLRECLTCCNLDPKINLSRGENCSTLEKAKETVEMICVNSANVTKEEDQK
ncbi:uncharacterized protein LOC130437872 isoform X2 [Triplophysa dalaica]|nr:uncharacterized protein LOC130437872 isoform X2 [Triplophysa dalaica]